MPRPTIASAAAGLLRERRAMTPEDLGREIAARGLTRSRHPTQAVSSALNYAVGFRRTSDGRWTMPAELVRGLTLTHRLTATARASNVLPLGADLNAVALTGPRLLRLADDGPLTVLWNTEALEATDGAADIALRGPDGWLAATDVGQLLHVRAADGILHVEAGHEPTPDARMAGRRMVETARRRLQPEAARDSFFAPLVFVDQFILDLLLDEPELFAQPLAPLGEVFAAAGLEVRRAWVGLPGTDWDQVEEFLSFDDEDPPHEDDDEDQWADDGDEEGADEAAATDRVARALGLTPTELEGLQLVLATYRASRDLGRELDPPILRKLARIVDEPRIAGRLATRAWSDPAFERFVATLVKAARPSESAGARFILGACAEARGDIESAERRFRSALESDPSYPLALAELARYDTDRGDYASALARLRAANVPPDDQERAWLESFVPPAVAKVGRNDPCPCGSGRKYKTCHLNEADLVGPVPPARALLHKLDVWLIQPAQMDVAADVLDRARITAPDDEAAAHRLDPLVRDIVLFDRDGLRRFLDVRGPLLPPAERGLAARWSKSRRSLYEVVSGAPGQGVTLRDLRSAATFDVADRSLSRQVGPLDILLLRLLPDESGHSIAGDGISVPRPQREHVLELLAKRSPSPLLRWLAEPPAMPRMANMEGDPIVLVSATYRVPEPDRARAALARKLRHDGGGRFSEVVTMKAEEWHRGSITLEGDRATIETNSKERADRLAQTLLRAAPGAQLIRREERGIEEAMAQFAGQAGPAREPLDPPTTPDLAAALEAIARRHEARWVDERIPALGGLTPRQALADPSARPRLEALLDDIAWQRRRAGPGGASMDPDRVRALLGLAPRGSGS